MPSGEWQCGFSKSPAVDTTTPVEPFASRLEDKINSTEDFDHKKQVMACDEAKLVKNESFRYLTDSEQCFCDGYKPCILISTIEWCRLSESN